MGFLIPSLIILFSSFYVIFLDYLASSSRALEKALVLPVVILLFAVYRFSKISQGKRLTKYEEWMFLFWGTVCVQLLIISTGAFYSPFLIFLPLTMIALGFIFTFPIALVFAILSLIAIILDIVVHQNIIIFFLKDPGTIILQILALAGISPIAYILSYKYHVKDWFFTVLRTKVATDETILESLDELIIVTDSQLRILSVNDAVERILLQSRSELLYQPLFTALLLKDKNGKLVTNQTFFPKGNTSHQPIQAIDTFTLFRSSVPQKEVTIQVQSTKDLEEKVSQISFIISYTHKVSSQSNATELLLEKARTKYDAMNENIKKKLSEKKFDDVATDLLLLEKMENDMYNVHLLKEHANLINTSKIDLAKLCQKMVGLEDVFAKAFAVKTKFQINNFGAKDIAPLLVKNFTVEPQKMTGPFFTVSCDVKKMGLTIKKLLDISIFLASKETDRQVTVTIERKGQNMVLVQIKGSCPMLKAEELSSLFLPYYGKLYNKTNLRLGSGLEGFLVKEIANKIDTNYTTTPKRSLAFTMQIARNANE